MRNNIILLIFLITALTVVSCDDSGNTGQAMVSYPVYAKGSNTTTFTQNGWDITITKADILVGPLELCAHVPTFNTKDSMTGCGVVMGEFSDVKVIHGIDSSEQQLGIINGIVGQVHSVSYDLGVSWPSTQAQPTVLSNELDGNSVIIQGTATKDSTTINFDFKVKVTPSNKGLFAIRGLPAEGNITGNTAKLLIKTEPSSWLRYLNWNDVAKYAKNNIVTCEDSQTIYNSIYYGVTIGGPITLEWK